MITPELLQTILQDYSLPVYGTHGVSHWARVLEIGRRLVAGTGASLAVVSLFAVFHDSRRVNEGQDQNHGLRGAEYAATLRGRLFEATNEEFDQFFEACAGHTDGMTQAHLNVQVCWDSDRLDLLRVGILPNPLRLCTPAARRPDVLAWANARAVRRLVPSLVQDEWRLPPPDRKEL